MGQAMTVRPKAVIIEAQEVMCKLSDALYDMYCYQLQEKKESAAVQKEQGEQVKAVATIKVVVGDMATTFSPREDAGSEDSEQPELISASESSSEDESEDESDSEEGNEELELISESESSSEGESEDESESEDDEQCSGECQVGTKEESSRERKRRAERLRKSQRSKVREVARDKALRRRVAALTGDPEVTEEDREEWSAQRRLIDEMSGQQMVEYTEAGNQVGDFSFEEWKESVAEDLKFGPKISADLRHRLSCVLYCLQAVVAANLMKPGLMKGVMQSLELLDPTVTPVQCKGRRHSPREIEAIREETQKLMDNGIIEYSNSAWAAPVVLVKKPDGSWRFCVNFTASCNKFLKHDAHRMPKTQDILDGLGQAELLSLWDVNQGYYSLLLREQDRHYTAFNTGSIQGVHGS